MTKTFNNQEDLRKAVEKKIGGELADEVWDEFQPNWNPPYDNSDIKEITSDLRRKGIEIEITPKKTMSAAILRSKIRARELEPWIWSDRKHFFGDSNPPFENRYEMEQWLISEAAKQEDEFGGEDGESEYLLYRPPNERLVRQILIWQDSQLFKLWRLTKIRANDLGCHEVEALAYILTGEIPFVAPIAYSWTTRSNARIPSQGEITITIREPVSEDQIVRLYRILRNNIWGKERDPKPIKERDIQIVDFVTKYTRGIRRKEDPRGWPELLVAWNKKFPDWDFQYEDAFRMAFKRAYKKVYPGVDWDGLGGHR